jgi:coenzyme F420-reducing hydrogenase delta subunit
VKSVFDEQFQTGRIANSLKLPALRFRLEHIAASEGPKFAKVVRDMTDELSSLGPSPYRQSL